MFETAKYIKPDIPFVPDDCPPAPLFRKTFTLRQVPARATLYTAALGLGYFYINGLPVTEDLFTAPVSDYTKTVWYTACEVASLLREGENVIAAECGNGFFNEFVPSSWDFDAAPWRDNPKLILQLEADGETVLVSDESFRCMPESATVFNQLRLGEHFDSRLYQPGWNMPDFDDSAWPYAKADDTPPEGTLRLCSCQGIRECESIAPKQIEKKGENTYLYDFGQNMSGYLRIRVNQPSGEKLTLRYCECCDRNGDFFVYPNEFYHYPKHQELVQVDEFICCGREFQWSPKFSYHGFRYVQIEGLREPCEATALFVHQDMSRRSSFCCSNEDLNRLFVCGIRSSYSNMFYMPTDCPTREKLGWCNDAQSSAEQFLTNFDAAPVLEKWLQDIRDSMRPDGAIPGIVPSSGWGHDWGNGPVSEGILFELAYRIWLHTGNTAVLTDSIPYFFRNLAYMDAMEEEGELRYGLNDWAAPEENGIPAVFVNAALQIKFHRITILAMELAGQDASGLKEKLGQLTARFLQKYIGPDGRCRIHRQAAVAMAVALALYEDLAPLKNQLLETVAQKDYHHDCGMVGLRYLYDALNLCGEQETALRIITAKGYPGYFHWLEDGATTLYEYWNLAHSKNHHMYSDVLSWMVKTPLGLTDTFEKITVDPFFFKELEFVRGSLDNAALEWHREEGHIALSISVAEGKKVEYKGSILNPGEYQFLIQKLKEVPA